MSTTPLPDIFRMLQAGDAGAALAAAQRVITSHPDNAGAHLAAGLALDMVGRSAEALPSFERAAQLRPDMAAAHHAIGWALHKDKRPAEAVVHLQRALALDDKAPWRVDLGKALADARRTTDARFEFEAALVAAPQDAHVVTTFGRFCAAQGDFARAADLFRSAWALAPGDNDLPMFLAQVELLRGSWQEGWRAYVRRDSRRRFEHAQTQGGHSYRPPRRDELAGRHVLIVGEQGLGDELFFLRFAPALRDLGARLSYMGEARLHSLLWRTGLFESVLEFGGPAPKDALIVLNGDLPSILEENATPPSLAIAPDADKLDAMRRRLERAGPRPWVGVTWRAGTDAKVVAHALHKVTPIAFLFAALPPAGTVVSLQRDAHFDELESASRALGRGLYDFSNASEDLEDMLALVALLDRHVGVSNTNTHLAAAAGASADVLVPFPPEWRWGIQGESPWFPGFRVYRQAIDGDWSRAFAALANAKPGSASRV